MTSKCLLLVLATTVLLASSGCATSQASPGAVETLRTMRERGHSPRAHVRTFA